MKTLVVLLALCGLSMADVYRVNLVANQPRIFLNPPQDHQRETTWDLRAPVGSKIVLACILSVRDCTRAQFLIDNGEGETIHCGPENYVAFRNSVTNQMIVTFLSVAGPRSGYCQVSATLPYLHLRPDPIDSTEDGTFEGKRKTSCKCGWANKESGSRIVGGRETLPNEYPFPVLLMTADRRTRFCGGSIISPRHVLTAAHCTWPMKGLKLAVMVGLHDTQRANKYAKVIDVKTWYDHPGYNNRTNIHDISILLLEEKIKFNQYVGPVCLPNKKVDLTNQYIKVMGWGLTRDKSLGGRVSPHLRKVNLRVVDIDICKTIYEVDNVNPTQVCTHDYLRDSCQGDSGGPLVWLDKETNRYVQVALVSYGRECASTEPGVNTDVYHYMPWINKIIQQSDQQPTCS